MSKEIKEKYRVKFADDKKYGSEKEDELLPVLIEKFGELKKLGKYAVFDFEGEKVLIELKSRKCSINKYKETIVGKNKIDKGIIQTKDVYFFFNFDEGLYYWKLDENLIGNVRFGEGGRRDRGKAEIKDYCYIPCELLIKI
jgi:hypothetical protein